MTKYRCNSRDFFVCLLWSRERWRDKRVPHAWQAVPCCERHNMMWVVSCRKHSQTLVDCSVWRSSWGFVWPSDNYHRIVWWQLIMSTTCKVPSWPHMSARKDFPRPSENSPSYTPLSYLAVSRPKEKERERRCRCFEIRV